MRLKSTMLQYMFTIFCMFTDVHIYRVCVCLICKVSVIQLGWHVAPAVSESCIEDFNEVNLKFLIETLFTNECLKVAFGV